MNIKIIPYTFTLLLSGEMVMTSQAMEADFSELEDSYAFSHMDANITTDEQNVIEALLEEYLEVRNADPEVFNDWADKFYEIPNSLTLLNALQFRALSAPLCGYNENSLVNMTYLSEVVSDLAEEASSFTEKY